MALRKIRVNKMIIGIVAISKNYAIGKNGKLPWHYAEDLRFFKQTTTGNALVMGSKTWDTIGRPLPNRLNIVLSRNGAWPSQPNFLLIREKAELLALSEYLKCDLFVIGGAKTFKTFADEIEKWMVTEIPMTIDNADTFMPEDFLKGFSAVDSRELGSGLVVRTFIRS